jgi:hypothetical protein
LAAWQIPFLRATDWQSVWAIWCDNASKRFVDHRPLVLLKHLVGYPLEVFGCLLPWSTLLGLLTVPAFRRRLVGKAPQLQFLAIALATTFATVWFAPEAKSRYFMPLYPCLAVLVGVVVEICANCQTQPGPAPDDRLRRWTRAAWKAYLTVTGAIAVSAGLTVAALGLFFPPESTGGKLSSHAGVYLLGSCAAGAILFHAARQSSLAQARWGVLAVAGFLSLTHVTVVLDFLVALSADNVALVEQLKTKIPPGKRLVSLGSVDHLFAFLYETPIPLEPCPVEGGDVAAEVEFFCFNEHPPQIVSWPFAWERVATVPLERQRVEHPDRTVVVGRRLPDGPARPSGLFGMR